MRNLRRTALSLVLAVALLGAMAVPALAANPTVSITVRAEAVSISIDETTWDIGTVGTSDTAVWGDAADHCILTNTGTVNVDVTIQGTDLVATNTTHNWVLADDGDAASETYALKAYDGDGYNIIVKKTEGGGFNELASDLDHTTGNTVTWSMTFYAPTAFNAGDDGAEKSGSVTLVASKNTD